MSLTIELSPELEVLLEARARTQGLAPSEVARRLLAMSLLAAQPGDELTDAERMRREKVMRELVKETERLGLYP